MINNLQILRAFAALFIAYYHTAYEALPGVHGGYAGVPIFFVISGFVMCLVSQKDSSFFMTQRIIRIVPAYWATTFILSLAEMRHVAFRDMLLSLLFIPHVQSHGSLEPIVGVGWTLNLEMYFYVVFAIFLKLNSRLAPILAGISILLIQTAFTTSIPSNELMTEYYANPVVNNFCYGILIYYAWAFLKTKRLSLPAPAVLYTGWLIGTVLVTLTTNDYGSWYTNLYPSVIVAGALGLSAMNGDIRAPWLELIGDASYILYLIHTVILEGLRVIFHITLATNLMGVLAFLIMVTLISCALHVYVERSFLKILRRRFIRRKLIITT